MVDKSKFIINTSVEYFNASCTAEDVSIKDFFDNEDITVLAATRHDGKIQFQHRVPTEGNCLLFYKIPQVGTAQPDGPALGLLTLEGGMVKSIYNSVSRVFSPHGSRQRSEYTPELSGLLENLHVSLGSTLGLPQTGITSVQDEINFWKQKANNASAKSDREQAQMFATILAKIDKQIRQIDQNSLGTVEEFLDSAHNNLDEIWRLPYHYPQNRMADLMDVICNQIIETCVENLMAEDVWNLSSYHVNNLMNQVLDLTDSWMQLCDSLTRLFWPNYSQHSWIGPPHVPARGQQFKERLGEIKNIKNLFKQIVTLLEDPDIRNMFSWNSPFKDTNIYDTSAMGQMKWNKALHHFEHLLQPIDERIAFAIKSQLHNHLSNPRQVIFIFSKYDTLIQRPTVLELLTIEREQFLQSLQILLQDLRKAMSDTNMEPDTGHLSTICNECRWLKIVQYQLQEIEKVCHLISGREGFDKINQNLQELKEETETLLRTNFEIWSEQSLSAVKSGELRLRDDQPVVKFEKEGRQLMRVTFNPKLVTFCQDVREFENLGYRVPIELRSSATHAAQFMSYARRLQQIATFHNTIGDRMIPCQRPIMLKNAVELSKLVQSESVAWNDEESVKRYVSTLQTAVAKLSADNNLLVGYHEQAKRTVIKLMNTDLLSQGQTWKDEMRHLRELVATLESQGYSNLDAFKLHWDHQLYKVLEYQYISGLVDMNNRLPDIHIDIVFRQRQLQFRPPEEEIRSKYYSQLKKFIERPLGFRGLSSKSSELFKTMVDRNRHHFGPLFNKAIELFKKLDELKNLWLPWVALGCIDVEELCNVHLTKWEHWDRNFKACKYFSQQIAKIQNSEENIDCFVVNILPLRTDIETISRRYWDALASSLRQSILNDISSIQEFLQSSLQFLQNVPMDESEIAESGAKYERITTELPKVSQTLEIVKGKDRCLAGWCKERVSALSGILTQWEKLQPLIENHSTVLQRQIEIMKEHVETQANNLVDEAEKFMMRWESTISELESSDNASLELFKERQKHWELIKERKEKLLDDSTKFSMEIPSDILKVFEKIEDKVVTQSKQWEVYEEFSSELEKISSEEWAVYRRRPYILTEFLSKWESSVHSSIDLPSSRIRQAVDYYQSALPVLQHLQSDALTERHWAKVFQLLKKEPKPAHTVCLKDVIQDIPLLVQASNEIQNLVRQASSEQIVRQALNELDQWAVAATLKLTTHTDSSGNPVTLIKDYQEVLNKVGDNQSLLQSAKNSAAFEAFSDQAEIWENRLNTLDNILTSLNLSQRKWIYLEPVFGAGTLKNEEALFKRIDKDFRYVMREIQNDPRVLSIVKINNITTIINSLENQLSRCQNTLMSYIMDKRNSFPRFYFLGDDDLLEILGQASKIEIIQKHIKKLFPGINSLEFENSRDTNKIKALRSSEGDTVILSSLVEMSGPIENWLTLLSNTIQQTLKDQIKQCYQVQNMNEDIINKYPIQVISTVRAINFTKQTEKALTSMSLSSLLKNLKEEITKYTEIKNRTENNLLQIKIKALLLDLVHYVTVTEYLMEYNVTNPSDWHWLQQMKFYLNKDFTVSIKMVFAEFEYSYEFLGNPNKLVHTSLTHKCYLTLTQAMHLGLGGNPFGPAGTGKTECVKALGAMMGRLVLVFNCDENVDTEAMGLILTGLARCGAWGCFDEFNRLQEATLSAISMLIQPIQTALKDKNETVVILDKSIKLNQHCGIFVTLNPAGEEYGGRQQLPGNIQALFRPIVMQQPEPKEISKVMLFVEGFVNANEIGDRIVELFDLAKKMLSAQRHYDWGLRELKTILLACGRELRNKQDKNIDEKKIVVQALRSNTMSKLNVTDSKKFDMLLSNVFPEVELDKKTSSKITTAIEEAFSSLGLYQNERQVDKVLQLYEQLTKRMGVVIVGPPCSGKTTIISILKQALTSLNKIIRTYTISPKSMDRIQLLGKLDPDTRQWSDGVLTTTAVAVNSEPLHIDSWIICDGDVDPEWIEALNSVLDDNKLLTLPSGWRIQFGNNVNFIFETHDLSHASPATISRMGIINLSPEDLTEDVILETFLSKNEYADLLRSYIDQQLKPAFNYVIKESGNPLKISNISLAKSIIQFLSKVENKDEFCVVIVKSLLGFIPNYKQNEFANKIFEEANIYVPDPSKAEFVTYNNSRNTVETYESDTTFNSDFGLIQTGQMKAYLDIIKCFLDSPTLMPFIIVGPSGSGKTLLLQNAITEFTGYQLLTINCSTQLSPKYILHSLKQNCITISGIKGREYKPQQSRIILFLKNIDLCNIDSWGTSDVIEIVLQLIQRGGFYSDTLEWISISGLQICASMTNISKQKLSPRYLAINSYLNVKHPSESDMRLIVQNYLEPVLTNFKKTPKIQLVVEALMDFFKQIQDKFTPEEQSHYHFTPKKILCLLDRLKNYPEDSFDKALITEMETLFRNRLVTDSDREEYDEIVQDSLRRFLGDVNEKLFFIPKSVQSFNFISIQQEEWIEIIQKNIIICNTETYIIQTPITNEVLFYTSTISRIISRPNSHLIFVGQVGSRCVDSLYIATTLISAKVQTPQGGKQYSLIDFYNDLKLVMQSAALEDQPTVFLIDHCWLTYLPEIMKPIEAILEDSEILELFGDDLESIASPLKSAAQIEGYQDTLASYFLNRAKKNLHVVLNLDSSSSNLDDLFTTYPALYKNAEMIWVQHPPQETVVILPKKFIKILSDDKDNIPVPSYFSDALPLVNNETPIKYYQLIEDYYHIFCFFERKTKKQLEKLKMGVEKLATAHQVVATLKGEAGKQEEALAQKRKMANDALEMISLTMRNANDQKSDLLELKKKTQENSEILKERKKAIEVELSEVEPILKEASAAVGQIKSEALSEIRSLRAPPEAIRDILEGVLRLMGTRDTSWNSMKSFLAKRGVKEDIRSLDPAQISPENCVAVERLLQAKADSFDIKNAKRASAAAAPLAAWVIANVRYSKVIQSIKPLEREQYQLQRNLDLAENEMKSLMSGLDDVDARVKELSGQLNVYTQEAAVLELKLEEARNTLKSSEVLVEKLSSEFQNWNLQLDDYSKAYKTLDVKSFLLSFSINYYCSLTYEHRSAALKNLTSELQLPPFEITTNLITDQDQIIWESMGISRDAQAIENASMLAKMIDLPFGSCSIPLIIDPSESAYKWLQEYLKYSKKSFDVSSQNTDKLSYGLELAVRFGKIILITDCQEIRPPIMQLLLGRIYSKFNKKLIQVGNKLIDLHEDFRLVLVTKLSKINIGTEISAYIAPIHFTITAAGLTDQLISKVILLKNPDLEERRTILLRNEGDLLKQRVQLEDKLLEELSTAQGDILKNEKLLRTLNEVKESSSHIEKSLMESSNVKQNLLQEYNQYRNLCSKASNFYIGLTVMYEISLRAFTDLFLKSVKIVEDNNEDKIFFYLVKSTYQYLCRSTPKDTRLTLGIFVCRNAFPDQISKVEWEMFVTNFMQGDDFGNVRCPPWIKKELTQKVLTLLSQLPYVGEVLQLENESLWRQYVQGTEKPEVPVSVSPFQKVLLAQIFRPDAMSAAMHNLVLNMIGINSGISVQPTMEQLAEESTKDNPILITIEPGNDPSTEIQDFANKKLGKDKYIEISVGRGMEKSSTAKVRRAAEDGKWICVKNVHLVPNWLNQLDRELESVKMSESFRLWIICDSAKNFPESFTYKCVKILFESPNGLKNKIRRLMQQWASTITNQTRDSKIIKLNIVLFILNSVLQERRKYIPQGWSKWYEFGDSDLRTTLEVLKWLGKNTGPTKADWLILQGLCEHLAYGGRISNPRDLEILIKHLNEFLNDKVIGNRWSPLSMQVTIPTSSNIQDYYDALQKFPDVDEPEEFGLSPASNTSREIALCKNVIKILRSAYFKQEEQSNLEKRIKPILSLWKKLASNSTIISTLEEISEENSKTSWESFILSELKIAAQLFKEIHSTLVHLHSISKEIKSLGPSDKGLIKTLADNQVPIAWRKLWSGPKIATDFIKTVVLKATEAEKRYKNDFHLKFADNLDLSKTFNPDSFFSALKLANATEIQKSSCDLVLISSEAQTSGEVIAKIAPLMIDGASFINGKLSIFNKKEAGESRSPEFYVSYVEKEIVKNESLNSVFLPLYNNLFREKLICNLNVSSNETADAILLSGAALVVPETSES